MVEPVQHVVVPQALVDACTAAHDRLAWLEQIPEIVDRVTRRWSLSVESAHPFHASAAWVAPAVRADGSLAVLKLGMPHMEAEDEIEGLRFWAGDPTVALLESEPASGAMLLERCIPGTSLRTLRESDQDDVIAALLRRIWRRPVAGTPIRPLSAMVRHWGHETMADAARWSDASLVRRGLDVFEDLVESAAEAVLLATDLHAGNVLRAEREPWLVIDPKPFVGERAFDATQHLLNCRSRLHADIHGTIAHFAGLLNVDARRAGLWLFARLAAEPRADWGSDSLPLARSLAPIV